MKLEGNTDRRSRHLMASDLQNEDYLHTEGEESVSMASAVSEDALVLILLKLPVKSLLRCRCVCKSWCSLVSSPIFISAHRNRIADAGQSRTFITRRCGPGTRRLRYTLHSDDESLTEIAEIGFPTTSPSDFPRILGSVNGLICLLNINSSLMLWNPAIRKSLILANPSVGMTNPRAGVTNPRLPLLGFGFGFDPLADDYKIVRVIHGTSGPCVDVYRLSALSWSRVDLGEENSSLPLLFPRQAFLNGVVHWLAHDSTIIGFDLRTETFTVMDLPCDLKYKSMEDVAIAVWCGSLALFEWENSRSICLWVMKKYGAEESWTTQCVISCVSFPKRIKGIASDGKILVEDFFGLLYWFDPATQRTEDLAIRNIGDVVMFHMKAYTESLVLLGLRNESIGLNPLGKQDDDEGLTDNGKKLRVR